MCTNTTPYSVFRGLFVLILGSRTTQQSSSRVLAAGGAESLPKAPRRKVERPLIQAPHHVLPETEKFPVLKLFVSFGLTLPWTIFHL